MAKRRSPARALFQIQEPCCCCLDASQRTVRCACGFSYCESCLHEVIHQWVVQQDHTNPDSSLISPADLDDASEGLPPYFERGRRGAGITSVSWACVGESTGMRVVASELWKWPMEVAYGSFFKLVKDQSHSHEFGGCFHPRRKYKFQLRARECCSPGVLRTVIDLQVHFMRLGPAITQYKKNSIHQHG